MPFAFAGLWEHWQSNATGDSIETATLITTAANDFMATLHHRMPIVLEPPAADRWLAGDDTILDRAGSDGPRLRAWPVSRAVNNARNESAQLIEAVGEILTP
jgi:putative SOS response-associated peptidase YedK